MIIWSKGNHNIRSSVITLKDIKIRARRCDTSTANDTTFHKKPNEIEFNNYIGRPFDNEQNPTAQSAVNTNINQIRRDGYTT